MAEWGAVFTYLVKVKQCKEHHNYNTEKDIIFVLTCMKAPPPPKKYSDHYVNFNYISSTMLYLILIENVLTSLSS